jgi:predicted peptidase
MKSNNRRLLILVLLVLFVAAPTTHAAAPQSADAPLQKSLDEINARFKNVRVQLVDWPEKLQKKLGKLKPTAFVATLQKSNNKPNQKLPLLVTLHGGGGKTQSVERQLVRSAQVKGLALAERAAKNIVVLEPNSADSWNPKTLDIMLDHFLAQNPHIDPDRVYVIGHSMGGVGSWNWILHSPHRFAAAAPCGFPGPAEGAPVQRLAKLPIWGMVGGADGNNVAGIQKVVDQVRATGNKNVRHTAFPDANHSAGNAAVFSNVECVEWMLTFSRKK